MNPFISVGSATLHKPASPSNIRLVIQASTGALSGERTSCFRTDTGPDKVPLSHDTCNGLIHRWLGKSRCLSNRKAASRQRSKTHHEVGHIQQSAPVSSGTGSINAGCGLWICDANVSDRQLSHRRGERQISGLVEYLLGGWMASVKICKEAYLLSSMSGSPRWTRHMTYVNSRARFLGASKVLLVP